MTGEQRNSRGMPLRHGVHRALEDEATRLIMESLKGVTSMRAKSDILTPWKEQDRARREVLVASGAPDRSLFQGVYHRAWNAKQTHLNSRDRSAAPARRGSSLSAFVEENRATEEGED